MNISMEKSRTIIFFTFTLIFSVFITTSIAADTITANQTIRDDANGTLESAAGIFQLGFFSPGSSKNRYLGIWYKKISNRTVIWMANRQTPIPDTSGILRIDSQGILVLTHSTNSIIWTSNSSKSATTKPLLQLLDTANLVLRYENGSDTGNLLWQSFDSPVNNILPGMKLGWDLERGLDRHLTSWKSANDPSPGNFRFGVNLEGYPQMLVSEGSVVLFRFGPWDGIQFSGVAFDIPDLSFDLRLVFNQREIYSTFDFVNQSIAVRFVLNPTGDIQLLTWVDQNWTFGSFVGVLWDECDQFALCGQNGNCNITEYRLGRTPCGCLKGYQPKNPEKWKSSDWSDGCVLKTQFDCGNDVFVKYLNLKLPDTRRSVFNRSINLRECEKECRKNCSCTGYSNIDIRQGGTGCMLWFDELLDIRDYRDNGLDFFIRTPASELEEKRSSNKKGGANIIIRVIVVLVGLLILLGLFLLYVFKKRKLRRRRRGMLATLNLESDARNENESEDLDLPLIDFRIIADATNNFSIDNKLGEGGFGPVYKGMVDEKQEIAVKRLSKTSRQGLDEFKNEVSCIAKLQHRNLVRLLGCCIEEGEMMLIYEYMPNKSLDFFIFDKELKKALDWPKRFNIINGISKGLLYLHQDSRLRIIHRDLKASNILLDHDMSPRISDFGLARSFGGNETLVNTVKVVGTYGYMSPEYAIDGLFSVKSDVYSFGVVMLEIMSGKKIRGFYDADDNLNLLGHAWKLYKAGKFMDLIDEAIQESCKQSEAFRAIQIGLLCVQPYPKDRPNMPFVVSMLTSENELPQPNKPGFFTDRRVPESESSSSNLGSLVSNELSVSFFAPR